MGLPPYSVQFSDQNFRKLLFFPVVNAIQQTKNGPWYIKIAVAEPLMKDASWSDHCLLWKHRNLYRATPTLFSDGNPRSSDQTIGRCDYYQLL